VATRNKFNASKARYGDVVYHSKLEARVAQQLDALRNAKNPAERVVNVSRQVSVPLVVNGTTVATWKIDFRVDYANGTTKFIEAKGFETADYRIKRNLFEALYPDETLEIVRKA
jgi:hypothetical protein